MMEINKNTVELVSVIEYAIGSECYNPNSYDGYRDETGCEFRYPVTISKKDKAGEIQEYKVRGKILENIHYKHHGFMPEDMKRSKYKFGSNHLYISLGIQKALSVLEKRYKLNFEELENKYREDNKND